MTFARQHQHVIAAELGRVGIQRRDRVRESAAAQLGRELVGAEHAALRRAAVEHVDAARLAIERELGVVDAELAQQAFERVRMTGHHRDLGQVPFALIAWQARQFMVVERGRGARRHVRNRHLASPFSNLNHQRHVVAFWHPFQREAAGLVGQRDCDAARL